MLRWIRRLLKLDKPDRFRRAEYRNLKIKRQRRAKG